MPWFNTRDIIHFYNLFIPGSYHIRAECTILNKYCNTKTVKHSSDWNESCKMGKKTCYGFKASIPCRIQWKWKVYRHSLEKIWFHKKIYNKIKQRSSTKQFLKSSELYKKYMKIPAEGEKFLSRPNETDISPDHQYDTFWKLSCLYEHVLLWLPYLTLSHCFLHLSWQTLY